MMKIKTLVLAVCLSLFMPACYFDPGLGQPPSIILPSESGEARDARKKRSGRRPTGRCESAGDCIDICEDVYDEDGEDENEAKVDACVELSYRTVIEFEDISDALRDPSDSNLRNIDERAFADFLDISIAPWVKATELSDLSTTSEKEKAAKALLIWIARDKKISEAIVAAYTNYESDFYLYQGVNNLFKVIGCSDNLTGDSNFQEIACKNTNSDAVKIYNAVPSCCPSTTTPSCPAICSSSS